MKWLSWDGSVQHTKDRKYCIVKANHEDFVAYMMGATTAVDLGSRKAESDARALCECHERTLLAQRRA